MIVRIITVDQVFCLIERNIPFYIFYCRIKQVVRLRLALSGSDALRYSLNGSRSMWTPP